MPRYYFDRLERLDFLIRTKSSGCPRKLADKLGVSKRTVFDYIDILKALGAEIEYDHYQQSYFYRRKGRFRFQFIVEN